MKPLTEILETIRSANDRFRTLKLSFVSDQTEILRDLSCSFTDLVEHKMLSKDDWLDAYNGFNGTNASKTRHADSEVRELALIRDNMTAVKVQIDVVRSSISAHKQQ